MYMSASTPPSSSEPECEPESESDSDPSSPPPPPPPTPDPSTPPSPRSASSTPATPWLVLELRRLRLGHQQHRVAVRWRALANLVGLRVAVRVAARWHRLVYAALLHPARYAMFMLRQWVAIHRGP